MKTLSIVQGSPEWIARRRTSRNASEASIIMGAHPNCSRSELIRLKARGAQQEFSDWVRKNILDKGHDVEARARPIIEKTIFDEELYPACGQSDDGKLCASFDGLPMLAPSSWECKQFNAGKYATVEGGAVPECDRWQVTQQSYVNDKCVVVYTVTDGTEEKTASVEYRPTEQEYQRLLLAWEQFETDLSEYDAANDPALKPQATGSKPDSLPSLNVQVEGKVLATNLDQFRDHAMSVLGSISRDLKTDEDFADAEQTVKWCKDVEGRLSSAKNNVLGQMETVDQVCRTIDDVSAETRRIRLELGKIVKSEKESRKSEIVAAAVESVRDHYAGMSASLGQHAIGMPATVLNEIADAIKGKKNLSSIIDAADTAAANLKIEASQQAGRVRANIAVLDDFSDHSHLFVDRVRLCCEKSPDDLRNLAKSRISEHEEREDQRLEAERERIRAEEVAKVKSADEGQAEAAPAPAPEPAPAAADTPRKASTRKVNLGEINSRIAPLSITAKSLDELGIKHVATRGNAKLYAESDFPLICHRMIEVLNVARGAVSVRSEAEQKYTAEQVQHDVALWRLWNKEHPSRLEH